MFLLLVTYSPSNEGSLLLRRRNCCSISTSVDSAVPQPIYVEEVIPFIYLTRTSEKMSSGFLSLFL